RERASHRDGIVAVVRLAIEVALQQTYDATLAQVDRGKELHHAASTKFCSSARPTAPLFSGWNCVAHTGPASIAAAKRRPYSHHAATTDASVGSGANECTK